MTRAERADAWRRCAEAGMSQREAAEALGLSVSAAAMAAKALGLTFRAVPIREAMNRPEVKERHREATREAMNRPEVKARRSEALNRPEVKARHREALNRPEVNPLVLLTPRQRADYDILRRARYSRDDALRAIGRPDLIKAKAGQGGGA